MLLLELKFNSIIRNKRLEIKLWNVLLICYVIKHKSTRGSILKYLIKLMITEILE